MTIGGPSRLTRGNIAVGMRLPDFTVPPISRTTLALFAGASGDHNPIHTDMDYARSAGFEDVFAHGMLGMAYLGRLLTAWIAQDQIRTFTVRFAAITPLHARPTCIGTVVAVDDATATIDVVVKLDADTTTLTGQAIIALATDH